MLIHTVQEYVTSSVEIVTHRTQIFFSRWPLHTHISLQIEGKQKKTAAHCHNYHWAWAGHQRRGGDIPHGLNMKETRERERERAVWNMCQSHNN